MLLTYNMEATVYHAAGHATMMVKWGIPIDWVAIHPLPESFHGRIGEITFSESEPGVTLALREADPDELKRTWFARMQVLQAGHLAEGKFLGKSIPISGGDLQQVYELEKASRQNLWSVIVGDSNHPTRLVIEELWPQISAVARALIKKRMLSGDEVKEILRMIGFPGETPVAATHEPLTPS